ncbi:MAG: hypothetical protein ABSC06_30260, partial [Rhodopila sp.]
MSETQSKIPETSAVRRSRRVPVIWTIPIIAIAIGAWLAWDTLSKEGPKIVVSFEDAEGLTAGQSQLKFKDITLGTVRRHPKITASWWHPWRDGVIPFGMECVTLDIEGCHLCVADF